MTSQGDEYDAHKYVASQYDVSQYDGNQNDGNLNNDWNDIFASQRDASQYDGDQDDGNQDDANVDDNTIREEDDLLTSSETSEEELDIYKGYDLGGLSESLFNIRPMKGVRANGRGSENPTNCNVPFCNVPFCRYMIWSRGDAYSARVTFGKPVDPNQQRAPWWSFNRVGATRTKLQDGRILCIGGKQGEIGEIDFAFYNGTGIISTSLIIVIFPEECLAAVVFARSVLTDTKNGRCGDCPAGPTAIGARPIRVPGLTSNRH